MVGGLADWFAVTALFRHPLGIPIPHTAIVVERKDQFAATLGDFIQERFLTPEAIVGRLRAAERRPAPGRLAGGAEQRRPGGRRGARRRGGRRRPPAGRRRPPGHRRARPASGSRRCRWRPLAGQALRFAIRDGRHQQALDAALRELDRYLEDAPGRAAGPARRASRRGGCPAPPRTASSSGSSTGPRRVGEMLERPRPRPAAARSRPAWCVLAHDLETSPTTSSGASTSSTTCWPSPRCSEWIAAHLARRQGRSCAPRPPTPTRSCASGWPGRSSPPATRFRPTRCWPPRSRRASRPPSPTSSTTSRARSAGLVSSTIARWDAEETANRLELLLGPDLQYIRINGTVVGALAGLALHAIAQLLG